MFSMASNKIDVSLNKEIPMINITIDALRKMQIYTKNCNTEIGWQGFATYNEVRNEILIDDVFLLEQEAHGTTCELLPNSQAQIVQELAMNPETCAKLGDIRVWGHSHVSMGVSPSGQDISQLLEFVNANRADFFVGIITNKRDELACYYVDEAVFVKYAPWKIQFTTSINEADIIADIKAKVKEKVFEVANVFPGSNKNPAWAQEMIRDMNEGKIVATGDKSKNKKKLEEKKEKEVTLAEVVGNIALIDGFEELDIVELYDYMAAHNKLNDMDDLEQIIGDLSVVAETYFGIPISELCESGDEAECIVLISRLFSLKDNDPDRISIIQDFSVMLSDIWGDTFKEETVENVIMDLAGDKDFLCLLNGFICIVKKYFNYKV